MNLLDAIVEHQNSLLLFYRKLEERFEENSVIRTLWHDMAADVALQVESLKSLPASSWNQFKNAPDGSFESAVKAVKEITAPPEDAANILLCDCFEISLRLSEPVVLKINARMVRLLRKNTAAPALNLYILIKSYVTRLARATESFAGDPMLIRRAQLLLAGLEKEVQEPAPEIRIPTLNTMSAKTQKKPLSGKANAKAAKETANIPPGNVKTASSKPAKNAPIKSKATSGKTPKTAKRA